MSNAAQEIRLADYTPPPWRCPRLELEFELDTQNTEVLARLWLEPDPERLAAGTLPAPCLDGEDLELLEIRIDGQPLSADAWRQADGKLWLPQMAQAFELQTRIRIHPADNTRLEGLYASGESLLTQCEAEGFRRITFFPDRPDVLSEYRVTLRADRGRYPVLLANGNPDGAGELDDGRHWARWHDPIPKPGYLFAIVAGDLGYVEAPFTTAEGREVSVKVWAAHSDLPRCRHALDCAIAAMRWDEQRFGRCYDLDQFNIVAAHDFNMGAMENKGLNIFNARYILADPDSATDADYLAIESVIGHEYFHNWSGNRVTLRDWFQLSLKEGLTVFRDQEFSADLHSRGLKRIEDVRLLKARQFAEDGGPLAHPVRPAHYQRIDNFYTVTVYEKGAELVRMLHTLLGEAQFRAGMDLYFERNDGRAATVEDFLDAMQSASGRDLSQFSRWYAQAGTPELRVSEDFDDAASKFRLVIEQRNPVAAEAAVDGPLHIPLRYAMYDDDGQPLDLQPTRSDAEVREGMIELREQRHQLEFEGLQTRPLLTYLQGLSAPVRLRRETVGIDQALRQLRFEPDPLCRWEASQQLWLPFIRGQAELAGSEADDWIAALRKLLDTADRDPSFVAECLAPPDFQQCIGDASRVEVDELWSRREAVLSRVADELREELLHHYRRNAEQALQAYSSSSAAVRRLRASALMLLMRTDDGAALAAAQYHAACEHTERLLALRALLHFDALQADAALEDFRRHSGEDPLRTDQWLGLVASRPRLDAVEQVAQWIASPLYKLRNPNRVRSLVDRFARGNPQAFHRADGNGYRLVLEQIARVDEINPQLAARLLTAFEIAPRLDAARIRCLRVELDALAARNGSSDLGEVLQRLRAGLIRQ